MKAEIEAAETRPTVMHLPDDLVEMGDRVLHGHPLEAGSALRLLRHPDILAVATLANVVAHRKWRGVASYSRPLRLPLHPTCEPPCRVCDAWHLVPGSGLHATTSLVEAAVLAEPTEVHLVSEEPGFEEDTLSNVETLVRGLREALPAIWIQGFTPLQIRQLARVHNVSLDDLLRGLQRAGLDGLLGHDEEIYSNQGRSLAHVGDLTWEDQMEVHEVAHAVGLVSVATLRYEPIEDPRGLAVRLEDLRSRQQCSAGFSVFSPVPAVVPVDSALRRSESGYEDVRLLAVSRLVLDNIPHIRLPWSAVGLKMGQVALSFGADDIGWLPLDPHVRAYAHPAMFLAMKSDELERLAQATGWRAVQVDGSFRALAGDQRSRIQMPRVDAALCKASCRSDEP